MKVIFDKGVHSDLSDCGLSVLVQEKLMNNPVPMNFPENNHKDLSVHMSNNKHQRKNQFSRRVKSGHSNYWAPVTKRRRLTACSRSLNNFSVAPGQEEPHCQSDSPDGSENMVSQMGMSLDKASSTSSSAKDNPDKCCDGICKGIPGQNFFGTELPHEKPKPRTLIDLNLPMSHRILKLMSPFSWRWQTARMTQVKGVIHSIWKTAHGGVRGVTNLKQHCYHRRAAYCKC